MFHIIGPGWRALRNAVLSGLAVLALISCATRSASPAEETLPYCLVKEILVGGEGGGDYLSEDTTAHRLYLSAADFEAPSAADSTGGRRRPPMVPGSFRVLVYGPERK